MEIVVFIAFMIVPIFTIVAFVMVLMQRRQVKALKNLVLKLVQQQPTNQQQQSFMEYQVEGF